jgi:hypothetical protein
MLRTARFAFMIAFISVGCASTAPTDLPDAEAAPEDAAPASDAGTAADPQDATTSDAHDAGDGVDANTSPDAGTGGMGWAHVYGDILASCSTGECHSTNASLDLSSSQGAYDALLHGRTIEPCVSTTDFRRVVPGDPAKSVLYLKISGTSCFGTQMPLRTPPLAEAQIEAVRSWISGGAQGE